MERRRSGRGGGGRDFGIFISPRAQSRAEGWEKPSNLADLLGIHRDTFPQPYEVSRVTKISRLVELTWAMRIKVFSDSIVTCRSLLVELTGADLSRWRHFRTEAALRCT